ncbi:MAG: AbrB/MazE/SpoVT family DNA-binding domain-containing protein [Promethearchaeota archaeon]
MAHTTRIDRQGRLIIPADLRKKLSLDEGSTIEIELVSDQLILTKQGENTKAQLDKWENYLISNKIPVMSEKVTKTNEKWYSEEYALNKLGL